MKRGIDLDDVEWWMSFGTNPRVIADHYGVSHAWLITKARREGFHELADRIRDRCQDDGDDLPVVWRRPDVHRAMQRQKAAS